MVLEPLGAQSFGYGLEVILAGFEIQLPEWSSGPGKDASERNWRTDGVGLDGLTSGHVLLLRPRPT